jgi:hypothetical protein
MQTMKQNLNEHEMTQKMIDAIRGNHKKMLIKEQDEENMGKEIRVDDDDQKDTITIKKPNEPVIKTDAQGNETGEYGLYKKYLKAIKGALTTSVKIDSFIIYTEEDYAVLSGRIVLNKENESEIEFTMVSNGDVTINSKNITAGSNSGDINNKILGYFEIWKKEINSWIDDYQSSGEMKSEEMPMKEPNVGEIKEMIKRINNLINKK